MPEGKIGLFPDVAFLAAAPALAARVAASARGAAAGVDASPSPSPPLPLPRSSEGRDPNGAENLLFSAEAALLFGLTGARLEGGEALVAAGLASFSVSSREGGAESLLASLASADFGAGASDASAALFAAAAAAARARPTPPPPPTSLLLLEAAAERGSLRRSLRRALDFRAAAEGGKEVGGGERGGGGGDGRGLSRALVALRADWEALSKEGGCAAATSALEAWLGGGASASASAEAAAGAEPGAEAPPPASCPLSSALTLRLASDAERERRLSSSSSSSSSSSLWTSDPAAALRAQLSHEFYPAARLAVSEAFAEGVRATLVEKGKGLLTWPGSCSSLEAVEDADVEALLAPRSAATAPGSSSGGLDVEGYLSRGCLLD